MIPRSWIVVRLSKNLISSKALLVTTSDAHPALSELKGWVPVNNFLKMLLKTAIYVMDQSSDQVDRASERVSEFVDRGKKNIYGPENHLLSNVLSFAAGVGVGISAGVLFAPASGQQTRSSLKEKVHDIGRQAR